MENKFNESKQKTLRVIIIISTVAILCILLGYYVGTLSSKKNQNGSNTKNDETKVETCRKEDPKKLDINDAKVKKIVDTYNQTTLMDPFFNEMLIREEEKITSEIFLNPRYDTDAGNTTFSSQITKKDYVVVADMSKCYNETFISDNQKLLAYMPEENFKKIYEKFGYKDYYVRPKKLFVLDGYLAFEFNEKNNRYEAFTCEGGVGGMVPNYKLLVLEATEQCDEITIKFDATISSTTPEWTYNEKNKMVFVKQNDNYVYKETVNIE